MTSNLFPLPMQSSLLGVYLPFSPGSLTPQFFPWIQKALNSDSEPQTFPVTLILAVTPVTSHLSVVLSPFISLALPNPALRQREGFPCVLRFPLFAWARFFLTFSTLLRCWSNAALSLVVRF